MQVEAGGGQIDRADVGRGGTVRVKAGGIGALALVAVQIELDGDAFANRAAVMHAVGAVTQPAAR